MPAQWANYLISAVRYNAAGTHIDRVKVHPDNGDSVGPGVEQPRQRVISLIEAGTTFATITWDKSAATWRFGASIDVMVLDGESFIRTRPDRTKSDNLGSLPEF
jgi:hypothetical protein